MNGLQAPRSISTASTTGLADEAEALAELLEGIGQEAYCRGFAAGLRPAQWSALRFFARANPSACTVGGFARARRVGTSTATQTIAALVRKGYLSRTALPEDRRIIRFQVTEAGHQLLQSDNPLRVIAEAIQALPGDERRALAMGLVGLGRRLPAVAPAATGLPVRSGRS